MASRDENQTAPAAPDFEGVDHVTQTLACCDCRGLAGCGCIGSDLRLRLGRLAWWLARRLARLGRPARCDRRPRLLRRRLRLWRLLCEPRCPDPVGSAVADGESLLLISASSIESERPRARGAFFWWRCNQLGSSY